MAIDSNRLLSFCSGRGITRRSERRKLAGSAGRALALFALLLAVFGCSAGEEEVVARATEPVISSASLSLKVLTNSCGPNQVQDFFQITNTGSTSVTLSDLTVKLWVNDTSSSSMTASISTGGCLMNGSGCFHNVTGASASVTPFSPACGPDSSHLANREITLATSDHTLLAPGQTWNNLQTALRLASSANFTPGTATWFSSCLSGTQYKADSHFALYYKGNIVFSSGVTTPSCRGPQGTQKLSGYVPSEMSSAPLVGPLAQSTVVRFGVGLPVRNAAALDTFVKQVSDPNSPTYRQYLTPGQFTTTYGPTLAAFQSVVTWANANGLTVDNPASASRLFVELHGTAANVEKAFYANLVQRKRSDNSVFYMLDREPSLDLATTVLRVSGLDNFRTSKPAAASVGTGTDGYYLGRDFRDYYAGCTSNLGEGQRVGVFAADGFHPEDIADYADADGLGSTPPITKVSIDGYDGTPRNVGSDEVELDIETVMGMAPGLDEIVVFETDPTDANLSAVKGALSTLDRMTSYTPIVNQLTASFDFPIDDNTQQYFNKMVAQGQTFFAVSGDTGSRGYAFNQNGFANTRWGLTLVGGTVLTTAEESAWDGSGGGLLFSTTIPDYQVGLDMSQNGGSSIHRNVPDVAMNATDTQAFVSSNGALVKFTGTSVSTPLWAGFMALINQQADKNGNPPLGFLNPLVYDIGRTPKLYASTFNDIQSGSNGDFDAVAGYDLVTGWGSPKCELITQLGAGKPLLPTRVGIAAGMHDACAVISDGSVECWGQVDVYGSLGDGSVGDAQHPDVNAKPTPVTILASPVANVDVGDFHACAVMQDRTVQCWGVNIDGELGDGTTTDSPTPVQVSGLTDAILVRACTTHTCAVLSNRTVVCWGANTHGQLGTDEVTQSSTPVAVAGLDGVVDLRCSGDFNCALDSNDIVSCWGWNTAGMLGDGTVTSRSTPAPVPGLTDVEAIDAADFHACAVANGGQVWCWGDTTGGLFGDGQVLTYAPSPMQAPGVYNAVGLALSSDRSCVLISDGTVMCAGDNRDGRLGVGDNGDNPLTEFTQVQGLSDVAAIAGGWETTCAMTSANDVYCWGNNGSAGFCGIGPTPVLVSTPTKVSF